MPRAGQNCSACQRAFGPDEEFRANLYEAAEGYERRDFCGACEAPAMPFSVASWRGRAATADQKKAPVVGRGAIFGFFQRLDADNPQKLQFRFVLALLLWRKKVLKFDGAEEGAGRESWRVSVVRGEEHLDVERPDLAEDELERLSLQLDELISGGPISQENAVAGVVLTEAAEAAQ